MDKAVIDIFLVTYNRENYLRENRFGRRVVVYIAGI